MNTIYTRAARVGFGALALSSIIFELLVLVNEGSFIAFNFFSYFTILANLFAGLFLIYFGITNASSAKSQVVRGAVTLYMLMTGVIFAVLLSGLENVRLTAVPWNNLILHYVMPIYVVLDWLLSPPRKAIARKAIWLWISFPIAYVVYTLIRGDIVSWYPYPFLNPATGSYLQVFVTSAVLAVFIIVSAFALRGYAKVRASK